MEAIEKLINQTRFRLIMTCVAVTAVGVLVLTLITPSLFGVGLRETLAVMPLAVAIGGFTGTVQVFLNERWIHRLIWLSHPEGVAVPRYEPVLMLVLKICVAAGGLALPLFITSLYVFNVTAFDLIQRGLERLPDVLLAYAVAFAILAAGFFLYKRALSRHPAGAPAPTDVRHLHELMEEIHSFSLRSAISSLLLWGAAAILAAWGSRFIVHLDEMLSVWVMGAVMALGIAAFPIQYFSFRKIFAPLANQLTSKAGETYRVESVGAAGISIEDEFIRRERLFATIRLAVAIPVWGALVLVHDAVEPFYICLLLAYTILISASYAVTYIPSMRTVASHARLISDGLALTLFLQYSGSMTTVAGGLFYLMIYSVALHHGFEQGLIFASIYSVLYGGVLLGEYVGWIQYAPAVVDHDALLDIIVHKSPWRHFHESAPFIMSFIAIAGGMFVACFLARAFSRKQTGVRSLLDLD